MYPCRTHKQEERKTLEIVVPALWAAFAVYLVWYVTGAKHYAPLTSRDARLLWLIHRSDVGCNARRWREVKRINRVVGFECECGHKHVQKRLIVSRSPKPLIQRQPRVPAGPGSLPYWSFKQD